MVERVINIKRAIMSERRKRLNQAVDWLLYKHIAHSVSEIAETIGANRSHFSSVLTSESKPVTDSLLLKLCNVYQELDYEWLSNGGESPLDKERLSISGKNIVNGNATNSIVGDVGGVNVQLPNKYGDSPSESRRWAPVIPKSLAKQPDFDIFGHIQKQMGGNLERLYSGTACVDAWHYVTDNDLYPHYQKGDCLGLKAYEEGDCRIKTGNVYVVDTKRDGFIFRRFRLGDNGDLVSYTFNDTDPQEFPIPKTDVIRVYSVVLMFRY